MKSFLNLLSCFLVTLLYVDSTKMAHIPNERARKSEVIKFMEVWNRSNCQPMEILVDILQEYPEEVEHLFKPSCVLLRRCGGCCSDEGLECVPTEVNNVTMEVMKIKPHYGHHLSQMHFEEHTKCVCRPKKDRHDAAKSKPKRGKRKGQKRRRRKIRARQSRPHCEPCSEKRKHLFIQDPQSCKCSCKFTHLRCKSKRLELNEHSCRCEKPRR